MMCRYAPGDRPAVSCATLFVQVDGLQPRAPGQPRAPVRPGLRVSPGRSAARPASSRTTRIISPGSNGLVR